MFGAVLIAPDADLAKQIETVCLSSSVEIYRTLDAYPSPFELTRLLNLLAPEVFFIEIGSSDAALHTARRIRVTRPETCIIGLTQAGNTEQARKAEGAGVNDTLQPPFSVETLDEVVQHALTARRTEDLGDVLAFLPAKAGSGSSTATLNLAGALARDCKRRVLLVDADLHSGLLAVVLGLKIQNSIVDALEQAQDLDDNLWRTLAVEAHGMDLLGTPRAKRVQMFSEWDYRHLLGFARERYEFVIVDLPEVVNDASQAIVRQARKVFVVCTPEMPSLFLARRRIFELQSRGVHDVRIGAVLNRWTHPGVGLEEVEKVLGRTVSAVVPNDYFGIQEAIQEARPIQGGSAIAKAFTAFARALAGQSTPARADGWLPRWLGGG